jgi:hypothetical protein
MGHRSLKSTVGEVAASDVISASSADLWAHVTGTPRWTAAMVERITAS